MILGVDVGGTFTDAVLIRTGSPTGDARGDPGKEGSPRGGPGKERVPGKEDGPRGDPGKKSDPGKERVPRGGLGKKSDPGKERVPGKESDPGKEDGPRGGPGNADGAVYTAKVPTTPADQAVGVLAAIEAVLARAGATAGDVRRFAHGMTVATNALLEGHAARTALIATEGFTDVIELGRQARPHLYRLCAAPPAPLVPAELRFAAPERCTPAGVLAELGEEDARALVERVAQAAPAAVAVALLHSYAHPTHEQRLARLLRERLGPGVAVSVSSDLVGTFREYERTATTVLDAALSPLVGAYLRALRTRGLRRGLPAPEIMQSSGGLASTERAAAHAALTVLSGPAGGVGGASLLCELAGARDVLCFDMGGTSCDVCLIRDGHVAETAHREVAGRPLALPALDIHTVGAGGGSIAWRDPGGALRVGPHSAGAQPGPACYGQGGERPTVTDANLLLGRLPEDLLLGHPSTDPQPNHPPQDSQPSHPSIDPRIGHPSNNPRPDHQPKDTMQGGALRLDRDAAERAVGALAEQLGLDVEECALGIVRVAEAEMLRALRVMTVERGIDPRACALMPFGGAGPLHACALAAELGIERVLCPRASGVLCALGLAAAAPRRDAARTIMLMGDTLTAPAIRRARTDLLATAARELGGTMGEPGGAARDMGGEAGSPAGAASAGPAPVARERTIYELRYRGQSHELAIESDATDPHALRDSFARAHEQRYGYRDDTSEIELVTIRASVWGPAPALRPRREGIAARSEGDAAGEGATGRSPAGTGGNERSAGGDGSRSPAEEGRAERIVGPAVIPLPEATLYVPPGWAGETDAWGTIHLGQETARERG